MRQITIIAVSEAYSKLGAMQASLWSRWHESGQTKDIMIANERYIVRDDFVAMVP